MAYYRKTVDKPPAPEAPAPDRAPRVYHSFVNKTLGPLFQEAEARFGVKVTPIEVVRSSLRRSGRPPPGTPPVALSRFIQASSVATWMRLAQMLTVTSPAMLGELLGFCSFRVQELLQFKVPTLAESRSIWTLWSLTFCPSNVSSVFHALTWGFFNDKDTGHIRLFELDRVRRGFEDCEFAPSTPIHLVPRIRKIDGCLEYRSRRTVENLQVVEEVRAQRIAKRLEEKAARAAIVEAKRVERVRLKEAKHAEVEARRAQRAAHAASIRASRDAKKAAIAERKAQKKKAAEDLVKRVVDLYRQGKLHREIAEMAGVDQPRVAVILHRKGLRRYKAYKFAYRGGPRGSGTSSVG